MGLELKQLRLAGGLKQAQMGLLMGASRQSVSRWERQGWHTRPVSERLTKDIIRTLASILVGPKDIRAWLEFPNADLFDYSPFELLAGAKPRAEHNLALLVVHAAAHGFVGRRTGPGNDEIAVARWLDLAAA